MTGKFHQAIADESHQATSASESMRRNPTLRTLVICLGALPLLYGMTGCRSVIGTSRALPNRATDIPANAGLVGPLDANATPGTTGTPGLAGLTTSWTSFQTFRFEESQSDLRDTDLIKVPEIARYMNANPAVRVGLDGSIDPLGTDTWDEALGYRRVIAIRNALIKAGIPAARIETGTLLNPGLARDRQVAVLFRSGA